MKEPKPLTSQPTRAALAPMALVISLIALVIATYAAVLTRRTHEEISKLGDLLGEPRRGVMKLDALHPPELDPDDR